MKAGKIRARWSRIFALIQSLTNRGEIKRLANQAYLTREVTHGGESVTPESQALRKILRRLGLQDGYLVDLASGDGVTLSPVLPLLRSGWQGLCIDADLDRFRSLVHAYQSLPQVYMSRVTVTPTTVLDLLRAFRVPSQFELLKLDIDSYDLEVANEILTEFQPSVVCMEINEKIPPGIYFSVNYSESHWWQNDHFYDCSLEAANHHLRGFLATS